MFAGYRFMYALLVNIFVLSTGRSGTTTFAAACSHLTNYSSGHETRCKRLGEDRLAYPPNHIEADNRLTWLLGRLERRFGAESFYVHLIRDRETVAQSFLKRWGKGIIRGYKGAILMDPPGAEPIEVCRDYVDTVNENIRHFLLGKPLTMTICLEKIHDAFPVFLERIGAEGDLDAAMSEWQVRHNASE